MSPENNMARTAASALLAVLLSSPAFAQYEYRVPMRGLAVAPSFCVGPEGEAVLEGQSIMRYESLSVPFGQTCQGETRTCAGGVLSGSFTQSFCTVELPVFDTQLSRTAKSSSMTIGANGLSASSWVGNWGWSGVMPAANANPWVISSRSRSSGKWFFEVTMLNNGYARAGLTAYGGSGAAQTAYGQSENWQNSTSLAVDLDTGVIRLYNSSCTLFRTITGVPTGVPMHAFLEGGGGNQTLVANFGAASFRCPVPEGHQPGF